FWRRARSPSRRLAQGRLPEALEAARHAMQQLQSVEATSHEGEVRLMFAEALRAAGDPAAVDAIRAARDRLEERGRRIQNPARRDGFLALVPENSRTLQLRAEWCR